MGMLRLYIMLVLDWTVQRTSGTLSSSLSFLALCKPLFIVAALGNTCCGTRNDEAKLKELAGRSDAKLVPVFEGKNLVTHSQGLSSAVLPLQNAEQYLIPDSLVFLGLEPGGVPVFGAACRPECEEWLSPLVAEAGAGVRP